MRKRIPISYFVTSLISLGATVNTNNTLYYSTVSKNDDVVVTTTDSQGTAPLKGFGVYMNNGYYYLNNADITTSGSQSDAIRTNGGSNYFYVNNLKVTALGTHADAINMASTNSNIKYTDLIFAKENSELSSSSGVTVRVNNYFNENSKSIAILSDNALLTNTFTSNATNSSDTQGYTVYAGNRDKDINNLGMLDVLAGKNNNTKGKSYIFIGEDSVIESNAKKGHAVYANKGGTIQLGDNVEINAKGIDAYAIFASTEKQGTYADNIRPGKVYLEGGATLRAENSANVIQAKGNDSVIMSGYLDVPVIDSTYARGGDININDSVINPSSGVFDIKGNISAIEGGYVFLDMDDSSTFVGSTEIDSGNNSRIDLQISGPNSVWEMDKDSTLSSVTLSDEAVLSLYRTSGSTPVSYTLGGTVNNYGGIINLSSAGNSFDTFTIDGNYNGNDGYIIFDTQLHDDSSGTDKLVITGDTSGNTKVKVNNIGGTGAKTLDGIELISVGGNSSGNFEKADRIVAGAYEYFLKRGNGGTTDTKNWYLTNSLIPVIPPVIPVVPPAPPIIPDDDPANEEEETPIKPADDTKVYRPESGSYLANNETVNNLFVHSLYDRLGDPQYTDVLSNNGDVTSMWIRNIGGYNTFKDSSKQLNTHGKTYILQLGSDIAQWSSDGLNRYHLGIMGGYGFNHNSTSSKITDYTSKGKSDGYNVGVYGTWFSNNEDRSGFYADSWLTYSWFDNEVHGEYLDKEKYSSKGITASLESGYTFRVDNDSEKKTFFVQPRAQVIYMGVKTKDHTESNGTVVEFSGDGNIQTRLGTRIYTSDFNSGEAGKKVFQPFAEATWIHNQKDFGVSMDGVYNEVDTKDLGEVKLGTEIKLNQNFDTWMYLGHQWGKNQYADTSFNLGLKYRF